MTLACQRDKAKRLSPTFSLRTLLLLTSLVCLYLGLWEVTKRHGVRQIDAFESFSSRENPSVLASRAIAPFVVVDQTDATDEYMQERGIPQWGGSIMTRTSYSLWIFGYRVRLSNAYDR